MAYGQEVKTRAYFSKDTLKVGEQVDFTIISDYPRGIEILFPDSTYNFSPFEYLEKYYQSTVSDATSSNDSVVYRLTTFSLDSVQKLGLPVFLISGGDSIQVDSNTDSLYLQHVITESIDSLQVKETIGYHVVSKAFNYPYLLIALAVLLVIAVLIAVFFGKEIKKRFKLYRLGKAHARFLETFRKLQDQGVQSSNQAERLLGYWKTYLERLEGLPYTKLTTKEIVTLEQNFEFEETLRGLDSNIYGEYNSSDISRLITKLKEFGIDRFIKKVEELKHA
jgi:hypothetical protein